jgi:ribosomal protein L25 (general stress protein Ctc)
MKKLILFPFVLLIAFQCFAQKNKNLARVQRLDGVEVYILAEPMREYETMTSVTTGVKAESILTGGLFNESITDKVLQYIRRARKQGAVFDAVLYSGGKSIVTIRFTDNPSEKTKGIARVRQLEGVDVYVLAEPIKDYETIISSGSNLKWKSYLTGGLVNNSIEEDMAGFIKKMRTNGVNMEGLIYSGGKSAISFKYK